jgi:hypothetical protein
MTLLRSEHPPVILEFPPPGDWMKSCLISIFNADTGEQIMDVTEMQLTANAEGLVIVEILHLPDADGYERKSLHPLAGVRFGVGP